MQKMIIKYLLTACLASGFLVSTYAGNTVMEPGGLLSEQFDITAGNATSHRHSNAVGASTSGSTSVAVAPELLGNTTTVVGSFTPGTTDVNYSPDAGVAYGNGHFSTSMSHSATNGTGLYNVYFTAPKGVLVDVSTTKFTLTNDGPDYEKTIVGLTLLDLAQDKWTLLGTAPMTSGTTYTVTTSTGGLTGALLGQVHGGLMFEPIPEPSTYAAIFGGLALVGAFVYRRRVGAKK